MEYLWFTCCCFLRLLALDKIIREAGLGTFGRVLECLDKQRNIIVAIKVVRQVEKYTESAKVCCSNWSAPYVGDEMLNSPVMCCSSA